MGQSDGLTTDRGVQDQDLKAQNDTQQTRAFYIRPARACRDGRVVDYILSPPVAGPVQSGSGFRSV